MNLKNFINNKIIRNASWLIGGRIIQMAVNLLVGIITARYLGPANYGLVNYGVAYTAFFTSIASLGINSVLVKEFVENPGEEGKIVGTSLFLRAISSFLSAVMIVCIVCVVDADETITIQVVALCSMGLVFHIFEVINYWFQSNLQSKITAVVTLVAHIITALYRVILMITESNVVWFAFATSVDYICIGIMLMYAYKKYNGGKLCISINYGKELLKKSCYFIIPGIMIAIYAQTDKIMLKQMVGVEETGYYTTAISLTNAWCFVLNAIIDSMYPSIMQANNTNEKQFIKRNKQLYAIIFYISIAASVMYTIFAELMIKIMYGDAYLPVVAPLRIICWYTAFSYLGGARNAWIVCKDRQKYLSYVYGVSALVNVVLNLVLIPDFGAAGAATASLITQFVTIMVVPFFIKDLRENAVMMVDAILLRGIR